MLATREIFEAEAPTFVAAFPRASSGVSVAAERRWAALPRNGASEELRYLACPFSTATTTMPSSPAEMPPTVWRSMTTEALPTLLVVTCSMLETSAALSPKAAALRSR